MRIALFLATIPLLGTPITTNSGSVSVTCYFETLTSTTSTVVQSTGPNASAACTPENSDIYGAVASGSANNLQVSGSLSGPGSYAFTSTMQDSFTETAGSGQGIEQFNIVFNWQSLDDPGAADAQAQLYYNGVLVWSDDEPAHGHVNPFGGQTVATVDEAFTYGTPFTFEEVVGASGSGGQGWFTPYPWIAFSNASLSVTNHDPVFVPEPATWKLFAFGLAVIITIVAIIGFLNWMETACENDPPVTDGVVRRRG